MQRRMEWRPGKGPAPQKIPTDTPISIVDHRNLTSGEDITSETESVSRFRIH